MMFTMFFQRALLYSGVNQLASGTHTGEHSHRNALKTMQRAVFLCPGMPYKMHLCCTAVRKKDHDVMAHGLDNSKCIDIQASSVLSLYNQMIQEPGQD